MTNPAFWRDWGGFSGHCGRNGTCTSPAAATRALDRLAQSEFHVLVTDVRMPDMDGVELLTKVRQHYPQVLRIVLTGQCGPKAGLQVVRTG